MNKKLFSYEKLSRLHKVKYIVVELKMTPLENVKVNLWAESEDNLHFHMYCCH